MPYCHLIQYHINFHWLRYKCFRPLSIMPTFAFKLQLVNGYIRIQKISRPIGRGKRCNLFMLNDISFEDDTLSLDPRQKKDQMILIIIENALRCNSSYINMLGLLWRFLEFNLCSKNYDENASEICVLAYFQNIWDEREQLW